MAHLLYVGQYEAVCTSSLVALYSKCLWNICHKCMCKVVAKCVASATNVFHTAGWREPKGTDWLLSKCVNFSFSSSYREPYCWASQEWIVVFSNKSISNSHPFFESSFTKTQAMPETKYLHPLCGQSHCIATAAGLKIWCQCRTQGTTCIQTWFDGHNRYDEGYSWNRHLRLEQNVAITQNPHRCTRFQAFSLWDHSRRLLHPWHHSQGYPCRSSELMCKT